MDHQKTLISKSHTHIWTQIHKNGTPELTMLPTLEKKVTEFG